MSQARELPPVALLHPFRASIAARSCALWLLFYGRPKRKPCQAAFGLN